MKLEQARDRLQAERRNVERLREDRAETAGMDESQQESTGTLADYDQHPGDVGTETFERAKDVSLIEQFDHRLGEIDAALERVDDGTYGRCEHCGREIEAERLEAEPATRYCAEHQQLADEEREEEHGMEIDQEIGDDL